MGEEIQMPLIWGAVIGSGAALAGDYMAQSGQASANAANYDLAHNEAVWNALQQQKNRDFNAQQAAINRQFQEKQFQEAATLQGTAEQRRVADLKAAGLNPLLATNTPGAGTPNPMSGATASAGGGGGGSMAPMQNTAAAFGNLGGQLSSAMSMAQTQAQIDLTKAQTKKTTSETPSTTGEPGIDPTTGEVTVHDASHALGNANIALLQAQTGLSQENAKQVKATADYVMGPQTDLAKSQSDYASAQALFQTQSYEQLKGSMQYYLTQQKALADSASNQDKIAASNAGLALEIIKQLLGVGGSALSIYNRAQYPTMGR